MSATNDLDRAKRLQSRILQAPLSHDPVQAIVQSALLYDELDRIDARVQYVHAQIKLIRSTMHTHIATNISSTDRVLHALIAPGADIADNMHELAPGISLPAISVRYEELIPDTPLYYILDTREYAVRISNSVFKGHIGTIDNEQRYPCRMRAAHDHTACRHAHDAPTWSVANWLYTAQTLSARNKCMRHFGTRDTLACDIRQSTQSERSMRSAQTMHDVLVKLCMDHLCVHGLK